MSKGTYTPPKPPTAKQMQKIIVRFEPVMNDIIEATKKFEPESIPGKEGYWIREAAFQMHGNLRALHDYLAAEEEPAPKRLDGPIHIYLNPEAKP